MELSIVPVAEEYILSYWNAIEEVAAENKYLGSDHAFPINETAAFIRESIAHGYPHFFVVQEDGIVVGWCEILPVNFTSAGYLGMGLLKEYREKGYGTLLLRHALKAAKEYGFDEVELDVRAGNTRAIHLYHSCGFVDTKHIKNALKTADGFEDVIHMKLVL